MNEDLVVRAEKNASVRAKATLRALPDWRVPNRVQKNVSSHEDSRILTNTRRDDSALHSTVGRVGPAPLRCSVQLATQNAANATPELIETVHSIFEQPWWLDTVAPGTWDSVELVKEGVVFARLPYMRTTKLRLTYISMPSLTQTLGPWLKLSEAKYSRALAQQKELMTALIEGLPPHDYFIQNFHHSITNHLPFYWQGFAQTTRYTYLIKDLTDTRRLWWGLQSNIRREIRKARKQVAVYGGMDIEAFIDLNELTFKRQGGTSPFDRALVRRLDRECAARNARKIFFASDTQGRVHAAAYIVWDKNSAYYLMGGGDPELRTSGATSLVMWEAIKFAAKVTKRFDFEGSMLEPVERFFRAFGAEQMPYFQVSRMSRRMQLLQAGKRFVRTIAS